MRNLSVLSQYRRLNQVVRSQMWRLFPERRARLQEIRDRIVNRNFSRPLTWEEMQRVHKLNWILGHASARPMTRSQAQQVQRIAQAVLDNVLASRQEAS